MTAFHAGGECQDWVNGMKLLAEALTDYPHYHYSKENVKINDELFYFQQEKYVPLQGVWFF